MVRHLAPVQGIKANACALALPIENRGGKKGTVPIVTNGGFGDTTGTVPFGLGKASDNSLIWRFWEKNRAWAAARRPSVYRLCVPSPQSNLGAPDCTSIGCAMGGRAVATRPSGIRSS